MTIKVSEEAGGPYAHEIDAIRDERYRARVMKQEPDFETLFAEVEISPGAYQVIADIDKPVELPVGEFVENVVFDAKETETPEVASEEGSTQTNPNYAEEVASVETGAESGNGETSVESEVLELEEILDTPIFDSVGNDDSAL